MSVEKTPLGITEVSLRDGHQSLLATRWRTEDMLPLCETLDKVGFWSIECWGGATYDAALRFLGEDPWDRLRLFRDAMPNSKLQMLLRGQNLLGYRHYADDVVDRFVRQCIQSGIDVIRVFDALNDTRNIERAVKAIRAEKAHAQGTISYTLSDVHNLKYWCETAARIQDLGVDSLAIKDMAGLLHPYTAFELVSALKERIEVPIHMQCHATTGLSTATAVKAAEAGLANVDTSISTMSMTYGHSPTETVTAIFAETDRATGLKVDLLPDIAKKMSALRKRYGQFEGSLRGVDARILDAQVPGGMLTNLENQLRQQQAEDRLGDVLDEIPKVRKDLGTIPLVTPTSQIVGTQAVLNVLSGERYQTLTKESAGILRGSYGRTPAAVNKSLQERAISTEGELITCRPADLIDSEWDALEADFKRQLKSDGISVADYEFERQLLSYAIFPQVTLYYLKNRDDATQFEASPADIQTLGEGLYEVVVNDKKLRVKVTEAGAASVVASGSAPVNVNAKAVDTTSSTSGTAVNAPLSGTVLKVECKVGSVVAEGDALMSIEAMKMETRVQAPQSGTVTSILVNPSDKVEVQQELIYIA